jgi:Zincin-like metallopeptidase
LNVLSSLKLASFQFQTLLSATASPELQGQILANADLSRRTNKIPSRTERHASVDCATTLALRIDFPTHIVLYQKNIEAVCSSEAEVRQQILQTLP